MFKTPLPLSLRDRRRRAIILVLAPLLAAGCAGPFSTSDYLAYQATPEQTHDIQSVRLEDHSLSEPVSVEDATESVLERVVTPLEPPARIELAIEEVRAAALVGNLDLKVQLLSPTIAQASVDEEEARFEATFTGSARRTRVDNPTALGTEGSAATYERFDMGVRVPLRTGGSATVNLPLNKTKTNNPFSLLDPAYTANMRFSISQPLLRGAGQRTNTYSIRAAKYQGQITDARTKLETIRVLAEADRVYWRLYAAQRQMVVRQQQYELALAQLKRAERRVRAGSVAEIEVIRAESGVAQSLEGIIITETLMKRRQRDLKRIMQREDLPMDGPTAITIATLPDPVGLDLDPSVIAEAAVANRMEMLELEIQLAIDASTIEFQKNAALPLVTVDYSYTINGLGKSYNDALDQVADKSFEDWSLGMNAEIPIGNEAARARLNRALLDRIQRLATKEQRRTAIRQEVFNALDQLQQNWQRILAARQDAILAGRTYEAEQRQFEVGSRTSTDVLDAAARLSNAQSREIDALADYQVAQIDLAYATGTLLGYEKVRWEAIDPALDSGPSLCPWQ